jgi:hypothetical protein
VSRTFRDWLGEGEGIYTTTMNEYRELEKQIEMLEQQLAAKKAEVNQIAHVIGKPPVETSRRLSAQLVDANEFGPAAAAAVAARSSPSGQVARTLSGRGIVARS